MKTHESSQNRSSSFDQIVEQLKNGGTEEALSTIEQWSKNPGPEIASQLEMLADFYSENATVERTYWKGDVHDFTRFVPDPLPAGEKNEEYWIIDTYSSGLKGYHERDYAIDTYKNAERTRLEVHDGETSVYRGMGESKELVRNEAEREHIIFDTFCHMMIAYEHAREQRQEPYAMNVIPIDIAVQSLHKRHDMAHAA